MQIQGFEDYSVQALAEHINQWIAGRLRDGYRVQMRNIKYQTMVNSEGLNIYSALVVFDMEKVA